MWDCILFLYFFPSLTKKKKVKWKGQHLKGDGTDRKVKEAFIFNMGIAAKVFNTFTTVCK